MRFFAIIAFLISHPLTNKHPLLALWRFVLWQCEYRFLGVKERIVPWLNRSNHPIQTQLILSPGRHSATANYYVGLQEYEDMALVLHILRQGDVMVDVGANVGAFTLLAASTGAQVISVEPSPDNMAYLAKHVEHNGINSQVDLLQMGVGDEEGELPFIEGYNSVYRIAIDGEESNLYVPVKRLDNILNGRTPSLIKIDVEGYEPAVIAGAQATLTGDAPMVIITEANGQCNRYGRADSMDEHLSRYGFIPCSYNPLTRVLKEANKGMDSVADNVIYVRDIAYFQKRVNHAVKTQIHPVNIAI